MTHLHSDSDVKILRATIAGLARVLDDCVRAFDVRADANIIATAASRARTARDGLYALLGMAPPSGDGA